MAFSTQRAAGCLLLFLFAAFGGGCGGKTGTTVTGTVTLDGSPIDSGFISFYPENEEGTGASAGGKIANGKYKVEGVTPGKNRVTITSSGSTAGRRIERTTAKVSAQQDPIATAQGNNETVEIGSGNQEKNFQLQKTGS
jgi:hypothetical protein